MWNWFSLNYYINYDLRPENRQKALNNAFYGSLFQTLILLPFLFFGTISLNYFGYAELIGFPLLGYLTHRGYSKAPLLLLSLFIVDRILAFINLVTMHALWTSVFIFLILTVFLWKFYYHAYLYSKRKD